MKISTILDQIDLGSVALPEFQRGYVCEDADARDEMKARLDKWGKVGFHFKLDWLLRNINTVTTGETLFTALKDINATAFKNG